MEQEASVASSRQSLEERKMSRRNQWREVFFMAVSSKNRTRQKKS